MKSGISPSCTNLRCVNDALISVLNQGVNSIQIFTVKSASFGASWEMETQATLSSFVFSAVRASADFCINGETSTVLNPRSASCFRLFASATRRPLNLLHIRRGPMPSSKAQEQHDNFILPKKSQVSAPGPQI